MTLNSEFLSVRLMHGTKDKKPRNKKPKDKKPKDKKPQDNDKQPVHTYFISSDEDEPVAGSSAGGASGSSSGV